VPDYDLTRLGSRAFEQLVVALARKELGPGVQVFGDGPDGGREATFEGTINWSATSQDVADSPDVWSGYTVLQAKFQVKPKGSPHADGLWLQGQISSEIAGWVNAARLRTRTRLPDYLIFVSNVDLSPMAKTGGIDTLAQFVRKKLADNSTLRSGLTVKGFAIWHADQLKSMLDAHQDVRWAFPGLLTVGDVLSMLDHDVVSIGSLNARDPLREELVLSLKDDRWIRLSQSGGPGDAKLWLDDIAIDLPALLDGASVRAVGHVLEVGDTVLRQRQPDRVRRPNVVVVGGPGQGKSTLSQLIAQAYRVAMLTDADPAPSAQEIVEGTKAALARLGLPVPANRRWVTRVDLAKYAEELASGSDTSVLRWISSRLSKRTDRDITPNSLRQWLRAWPWALILDGLDEVPSQRARRLVYDKLNEFHTLAEDQDADLLLVVTTRPTGYDERLPDSHFQHLELQQLPPEEAAAFAQRITDKRFTNDDVMRARVAERMLEASRSEMTVRLMETPLQVTIMSFIVEKYPTLPPDRFTLFDLYYKTMCEREIAKDIPAARFLSQHRVQVDRLHERVGLTLQVTSERADGAEAVLSLEQLHDLAVDRFVLRGFDAEQADEYAVDLVRAATNRLVLLVPREGGVGFDIRTLQELMAAKALSEGDDREVMSRLQLIAHHPHWRNTWLLAAGHLLLTSERFEKRLLDLLKRLDTDTYRLNARFPTAPTLAADLLQDNLAVHRPAFERGLIQRVLAGLERPPAVELRRLGAALLGIAGTPYRSVVFERLASSASGGSAARAAAVLVLFDMHKRTSDGGPRSSIEITQKKIALTMPELEAVMQWEALRDHDDHVVGAQDLAAHLEEIVKDPRLTDEEVVLLRRGLSALSGSRFRLSQEDPDTAVPVNLRISNTELLLDALASETIATSLEMALEALPATQWAIESMLGAAVKPAQNRRPVGDDLLRAVSDAEAYSAEI